MTTLDICLTIVAMLFCFLWIVTAWLNHLLIQTVERQTEWVKEKQRILVDQAQACDELTTQIVASSLQERIVSMWESKHIEQEWSEQ